MRLLVHCLRRLLIPGVLCVGLHAMPCEIDAFFVRTNVHHAATKHFASLRNYKARYYLCAACETRLEFARSECSLGFHCVYFERCRSKRCLAWTQEYRRALFSFMGDVVGIASTGSRQWMWLFWIGRVWSPYAIRIGRALPKQNLQKLVKYIMSLQTRNQKKCDG